MLKIIRKMFKLVISLLLIFININHLQAESTPISLNFQKIEIRSVLQLLAEFVGINLVVSDKVTGEITLKLNNIPWDQALDVILRTNSLEKSTSGNIMLIQPARVRKKASRSLHRKTALLSINYAKAQDLAKLLKEKNTKGNVGVDERTNTIWIQDTEAQLKEIRKLINQLDVPAKQVLIEARIVNMTRSAIQDLGIRFGARENTSVGETSVSEPLTNRLQFDLLGPSINPASLGFALAKLGDGILLDLELSALESENKAEIIASPKLMTINQQTATIESGEEIPYQEATNGGATAVTFKKAVLSLKVTPQITPDNRLLMALHINQDSPSVRAVNGVPAILTKEIQTNVLVSNGQTVVLGGIYKEDIIKTERRVPFLGDLPVFGNLFKNIRRENRNEELLIFITPRIITNFLSAIR
jgi:type IV pilus assembly protein PilQ